MRIVIDYRPALSGRTGVGEYIHELVRAYTRTHGDIVAIFTSSWKDRPATDLGTELGVEVIDRRVPVTVLNYAWHRLEWPPVEALAGAADVAHAAHPLLIPTRKAAQIVTIHDLFFLSQPERTTAEIRRDYPTLAPAHARRADAVITSSQHTRAMVTSRLGVPAERVYVCPPGAPRWRTLGRAANVPAAGVILFVGTLEPRKNIGALLDAYQRLLHRRSTMPPLVLAGRATAGAAPWLERIAREPLRGHVTHLGYVPDAEREQLYAGARVLVLPSLDEGFGLPALEAMSAGVPVVAANRGALPEVVGSGGTLVDPDDIDGLAAAIERLVTDREWAEAQGRAGLERARAFTWEQSVRDLRGAYVDAVARRSRR
jgi:glycosyltransferase involved in cell wall biosynthesis